MQSTHSQQNEKTDSHRRPQLLTTKEAASYLGYSPYSLRRSRTDNLLAGITPPEYIKRGSRVFYSREALEGWMSQFLPQTSTAENRRGSAS